jgi:hypothetical protein
LEHCATSDLRNAEACDPLIIGMHNGDRLGLVAAIVLGVVLPAAVALILWWLT